MKGLLASGHLGSVKVSLETNNPELPHFRQVSADHHLEDENFATLRYSQEASQHSSNKDICSPHVAGQEGEQKGVEILVSLLPVFLYMTYSCLTVSAFHFV